MYKLAEKELLEEREKLEKEFEPAEQELNEIKAKFLQNYLVQCF